MEQVDQLILDTADRLLGDLCDPEVVNDAENGQVPDRLAEAVIDAGLPLAWVPESAGGVGGSLALGFALVRRAAGVALPLPLVDTLLANLLLARGGLALADRWAAFAFDGAGVPVLANDTFSGCVDSVAGMDRAGVMVTPVVAEGALRLATFDPGTPQVDARPGLAGEPCSRVRFNESRPLQLSPPLDGVSVEGLRRLCALASASQIAGALDRMTSLTVAYVRDRQQFGRPLAKFQAIQHMVADMAGESALTGAAVEQAVRLLSAAPAPLADDESLLVPVATAKVVASEAAGRVARLAHQAHGAMGFSFEYPLHQYSRRVWSWREDHGSEFYWSGRIGRAAAGSPAGAWGVVTGES